MIDTTPFLPHAPAFVVITARVGGIFLLTPLLSASTLPVRARVLLILALSVAVYPLAQPLGLEHATLDLAHLAPLIAGELLVGVCIGVIATIPILSVQIAGKLMGTQMGLGIADTVDPNADIQGDTLGQLLFMIAVAAFLAAGGLDAMLAALIESYQRIPAGGLATDNLPLETYTALITSGNTLAVRIALPVVAIIMVENLVVGYLMKTVPTLNIMTFGFPIKIVMGLCILVIALTPIAFIIGEEVWLAVDTLEAWVLGFDLLDTAGGSTDGR